MALNALGRRDRLRVMNLIHIEWALHARREMRRLLRYVLIPTRYHLIARRHSSRYFYGENPRFCGARDAQRVRAAPIAWGGGHDVRRAGFIGKTGVSRHGAQLHGESCVSAAGVHSDRHQVGKVGGVELFQNPGPVNLDRTGRYGQLESGHLV